MQKDWKYRGIFAPVLTPYKENGEIDYDSLRKMVDFTIDCGCHGIVPTANAAEFDTLSDEEHHETIRVIVNQTNGRMVHPPQHRQCKICPGSGRGRRNGHRSRDQAHGLGNRA